MHEPVHDAERRTPRASDERAATGPAPQTPPTLATVADEAGVSRQTVSNALNNPELLRPETLLRVQSVIDRLGYSPNRAARQLRTRSSHLIGLRFEAGPGGHQQRADGPVPAQPDRGRLAHRAPRAAVLRRRGGPARRVRRPAALHRRRRLRGDRHLRRHPAGRLPAGPRGARSSPSADRGTSPTPTTPGSTSTAPTAPGSPPSTCSSRVTDRIAWLGWEKTSRIGQDRRSGWETRDAARPARTSRGLGVRITDNVDAARMAAHDLLEDPSITGFACASDTLGDRRAACLRRARPATRRRHRRGRLRRLARRAGHLARADLGAPAARAGRRRAGPDPAPRARPQADRRPGPDAASPPSSYAARASAA